jgi:pyrroline-5-carboxylate reductase
METINVKIACIGSGNMGFALMKGAAAIVRGANIGFTNRGRAKADAAAKALGASVYASNADAVAQADFVFLAVKPRSLEEVLTEIAPTAVRRIEAGKPPVFVSMAAGWSIARIKAVLRKHKAEAVPVVRIMPNTPALVGQGFIAIAVPPELDEARAGELERVLSGAGLVERLDEGCMDAAGALSGCGPAFVCMFIEALADGGVRAGLPRDKALRYAAQTVLGTAAMIKESGRHPAELKDMVCSPAGTTIAGVAALENGAFRGSVMNAVDAAYRRTLEL